MPVAQPPLPHAGEPNPSLNPTSDTPPQGGTDANDDTDRRQK